MAETNLELHDLVSESQSRDVHSLRKILDIHGIEEELPDYQPDSHGEPIELENGIYIWERKEDIPDELPDANYIIIDTIYFSTTSIEALSNGVDKLHIKKTDGELRRLKQEKKIMAGGESTNYEPKEGFDFFNSPSNVRHGMEREVAMTSDNGAIAALTACRNSPESSDIYVGSTSNARSVASEIQGKERPVHIICSGLKGSTSAEDHIAAYLIARYLEGQPLDREEMKTVEDLLEAVKDYIYEEVPDIRQIDIQEHVKQINSRDTVPKVSDCDGNIVLE